MPEEKYGYTDDNFNFYPTGPSDLPMKRSSLGPNAKIDEPFTVPKPEEYTPPQEYSYSDTPKDYSQQTRYEDMGECPSSGFMECAMNRTAEYADESFAPAAKSVPQANANPNMFQRYFGLYPLSQRIEDKKRGVGVQRYPIICTSPCSPALLALTPRRSMDTVCGYARHSHLRTRHEQQGPRLPLLV